MKLPPVWKIKRELMRLWRQARAVPKRLMWFFLATPYHDLFLARKRKTWAGTKTGDSRKAAVYVIYPTDGLLPSHLHTLNHLIENGYRTTVVSNLPLADDDREKLLAFCQSYIERVNFGYDFGGYRDGVLSLAREFGALDRLALLNDSAWYPLPDRSNWLADAEALGVDFAGAVSNYGTPRVLLEDFRTLKWSYKTTHPNFHYCSFALSFGPALLQSRKFLRFWRKFRLDNDKSRVVRRGEIGLTQWALSNGFSHACTCPPQELETVLNGVSDTRIAEILNRIILPEFPLGEAARQKVLAIPQDEPDWRHTATRFILFSATSQGTSYALPELTTHEMNFPFLKKSPLRLSLAGSDTSLEMIAEIPGEIGKIMMDEANVLRSHRTTKYDLKRKP